MKKVLILIVILIAIRAILRYIEDGDFRRLEKLENRSQSRKTMSEIASMSW